MTCRVLRIVAVNEYGLHEPRRGSALKQHQRHYPCLHPVLEQRLYLHEHLGSVRRERLWHARLPQRKFFEPCLCVSWHCLGLTGLCFAAAVFNAVVAQTVVSGNSALCMGLQTPFVVAATTLASSAPGSSSSTTSPVGAAVGGANGGLALLLLIFHAT